MIKRIVNLDEPKVSTPLKQPLSGDATKIKANEDKLYGTIDANAKGDWSGMVGDCTGIFGDATNLKGNLDLCDISAQERQAGVDIKTLVAGT